MALLITNTCTVFSRSRQLVLTAREDGSERSYPAEDLDIVIIDNVATTISLPARLLLSECGVAVVTCNANHLPEMIEVPLHTHYRQGEVVIAQSGLPGEARDALWQQTVRSKISNQSAALGLMGLNEGRLRRMAATVAPGDATNREGVAAKEYWRTLFGEGFRRERYGDGANPMLNYGYTILRTACVRAICSCGLLPQLGIHHHNKYDNFPLADDLMEPYRPIVDMLVCEWLENGVSETTPQFRAAAVEMLYGDVVMKGKRMSLESALKMTARSLVDVCGGSATKLLYPVIG